ncbi:MAG: SdiA-regulated domain-containing protein [Bacteroidota bacterium]
MKRNCSLSLLIVIFITLTGAYSCMNAKNKYTSPDGYDFLKPDKFNMPSSLLEISGIAFHDGNSDTIYSIQDEDGKLFRQKWDVQKQKNMKFAPKGDYEDLAILHDQVLVLKSSGSLFSFSIGEAVKKESDQVKELKHVVPKGEYESIYADPNTNKLYILCKSCSEDKKNKQVSGYVLDYDLAADSVTESGTFKIDLSTLKQLNTKLKTSSSPSALTRNAFTGEWYVLSSANKLLLVTDADWKIKAAHHLNSSTFNQPEGLAFDKDRNLYISNEGDEITDGNIIKFKYAPSTKK